MATTKATLLGHRSATSFSDLTLSGDLTVNGTTTTLDTAVQSVDKLEIGANSDDYGAQISQAGTGAGLKINNTSTGNILQLQDGGTDVMVVKDGGNVGVGTSTPDANAKLHVYQGNFFVQQTSGSVYLRLIPENNNNSYITLGDSVDENNGVISYENASSLSDDAMGFQVGNSRRVTILGDGKVGIGQTSPSGNNTLTINGASYQHLQLQVSGTDRFYLCTDDSVAYIGHSSQINFRTGNGSSVSGTDRMAIDSAGNIGAPSGSNIYNASDARLKQNITNLSGSLGKIKQMQGVSFQWIDGFCESESDKTLYGLIAQELQTIDSNLVDSFSENTITIGDVSVENPLRVNEKFIIPMLIEAVKELSAKVTALENA